MKTIALQKKNEKIERLCLFPFENIWTAGEVCLCKVNTVISCTGEDSKCGPLTRNTRSTKKYTQQLLFRFFIVCYIQCVFFLITWNEILATIVNAKGNLVVRHLQNKIKLAKCESYSRTKCSVPVFSICCYNGNNNTSSLKISAF